MRNRVIYQGEQLYLGPEGPRACNSPHSSLSESGNINSSISGENFVSQLFRIQNIGWNFSKNLTDVNQFGELASIDRVALVAPTVELNYSYLLSNFINEGLMGLVVNQSGDSTQVSCLSGILNNTTDSKNYFIKTVSEGADVASNASNTYNVISLGNCYLNSYTSQGAVNSFPTVQVGIVALNIQGQSVNQLSGARIPAIESNGSVINFGYILPTGTRNYLDYGSNSNDYSLSVLRPGDVNLSFQMGEGDGFYQESDLKLQSYNLSFVLNREDLSALGSKYYIKKTPSFPIVATLECSAIIGESQTGVLTEIIRNNKLFNPSINIKSNIGNKNTVVYYSLTNATLDSQERTLNIRENALLNFRFSSQLGSNTNPGLVMSGISFSNSLTQGNEDWGLITEIPPDSSEDWDLITNSVTDRDNWKSII